jgi:hypothetical protein
VDTLGSALLACARPESPEAAEKKPCGGGKRDGCQGTAGYVIFTRAHTRAVYRKTVELIKLRARMRSFAVCGNADV